ncbi:MAG: hypothetical protein EXR62_11555 [Chloroflexi bacterium]|nr:hypothetical protein [Chloroflexota bacterium]
MPTVSRVDWVELAVETAPTIVVRCDWGDVVVSGDGPAGVVKVGATFFTNGWSQKLAQEGLKHLGCEVRQKGAIIYVDVNADPTGFHLTHKHEDAHLEIVVPGASDLDLDVNEGSLSIYRITGSLRARMGVGNVAIQDVTGPLNLHVVSGAVGYLGTPQGQSVASIKDGQVVMALCPDTSLHLDAEVHDGILRSTLPGLESGSDEKDGLFNNPVKHQVTGIVGEGEHELQVHVFKGDLVLVPRRDAETIAQGQALEVAAPLAELAMR